MVRQDIVAGLRNALERGISIDSAKNSLLSAGYSMEDVEEATNFISAGAALSAQPQYVKSPADHVRPSKSTRQQTPPRQFQPQMQQQSQQFQQFQQIPSRIDKKPKFFSRNWKIMILSIVLILLIVAFALILLFKDSIADMFF